MSSSSKDVTMSDYWTQASVHGVHFFADRSATVTRKFIWMCILLISAACLGLMIYQKVTDFKEQTVVTNVEIDYVDELTFPAVAICPNNQFKWVSSDTNQSAFLRITKSTSESYDLLQTVYKPFRRANLNETKTKLDNIEDPNVNSFDFHKELLGSFDDMLTLCIWPNGTECYVTDFQLITTDFGLCYAINTDSHHPMVIEGAGSAAGLQLVLNVETFERMPGPEPTDGVKIVVYNQTDIPYFAGTAIEIPPGFLSQLGLEYEERIRLKTTSTWHQDTGGCVDSIEGVEYYDVDGSYSSDKCVQDRRWKAVSEQCGCEAYNAPTTCGYNGENCTRFHENNTCSLQQHYLCAHEIMNSLSNDSTLCPSNCTTIRMQPTLSMSKLPTSIIRTVFGEEKFEKFQTKYKKALDLQHVRQDGYKSKLKHFGERFREIVADYKSLFIPMETRVQNLTCFNDIANIFKETLSCHPFFFTDNDVAANNEDVNVFSYIDTVIWMKRTGWLKQVFGWEYFNPNDYKPALDSSCNQIDIETGSFIVYDYDYPYTLNTSNLACPFATPITLSNSYSAFRMMFGNISNMVTDGMSFGHDHTKNTSFPDQMDLIMKWANPIVREFRNIVLLFDVSKYAKTPTSFLAEFDEVNDQFDLFFEHKNFSMIMLSQMVADHDDLIRKAKELLDVFNTPSHRNKQLSILVNNHLANELIDLTDSTTTSFTTAVLNIALLLMSRPNNIQNSYIYLQLFNQSQCAQRVTSLCMGCAAGEAVCWPDNNLPKNLIDRFLFNYPDVRNHTNTIYDIVNRPRAPHITTCAADTSFAGSNSVTNIFDTSLMGRPMRVNSEEILFCAKAITKLDWVTVDDLFKMECEDLDAFAYDMKQLVQEMHTCINTSLKSMLEVYTNRQTSVLTDMTNMYNELLAYSRAFLNQAELTDDFLTENMAAVNIYYEVLSKTRLTQTDTYNIFSLFCDIGGTMGLFLGASVISIFELIDWMVIRRCLRQRRGHSVQNLSPRVNKTEATDVEYDDQQEVDATPSIN